MFDETVLLAIMIITSFQVNIHYLRDDAPCLAGSSTDSVCSRPITCWKTLSWNNKGGSIGPEVGKEVA